MNNSAHSAVSLAPRPAKQVLQNILRDLWRYKLVVPAVAVLVAGAVTLYTTRQPRVYEALATLEYDPNPSKPLGDAIADTAGSGDGYWSTQEFYETQNYILKSRGLSERVVRKLGLHHDAGFLGVGGAAAKQFAGVTVEQAAQALLSRIKVTQIQDTRVVRISVEDQSPERAQLIANSLVDEHIQKSLEDRLGSSGRALEWLSAQMEGLKREVENSEFALYKFREENQSLSASLEERQKLIANQLHSYSEKLTQLRQARIQKDARLSVLREQLALGDGLLATEAGPFAEDNSVQDLRNAYRQAAAELEKLQVTYGAAHPQVQTARVAVETLKAQLIRKITAIVAGAEADLGELSRSEQGMAKALAQINQQGLALSLQETAYSRLDRDRKSKSELYNLVVERAAQTDLTRALRVATARVVDRALKPTVPIRPKTRLAVIVGCILGLMAGVAVALGISQLDNKVRSLSDLESRGVTVLGVIPSVEGSGISNAYARRVTRKRRGRLEDSERDLIVFREPRSTVAECCRTIRTNLTFQSADRPLRAFAVTSAMPRDGKSTVAISLSITMAQSGRRVLLVDTDLRKPRLHKAFKVPPGAGVTSILAGEASLESATQSTDVPGLTLLQCGPIPPNPSELLHTRRFAELVEEARNNYDLVIFDSPPLGAVTDPAIISTLVDGMIVVIRARSTTRGGVTAALRQLRDVSARVIGAVLNDVDLDDSSYGAYYSYYRAYYAEDEQKPPRGASKAQTPT
jgi:polysaccharide biosynthesis transport protein